MLTVDYKIIGFRIKEKRKKLKLTQEQLAEKLSVTVGYVSQMERGVTKINLDMLAEIGSILDEDIAFFVTGVSTKQNAYLNGNMNAEFSKLSDKEKRILLEMARVLINNR